MNLGRDEFANLLKFMRADCLDEEAHLFFDYLLHQKIQLYKQLYPHLNFKLSGVKYIDAVLANGNAVQVPEKISYTEFITFFQKSVDNVFLTGMHSDNVRRPSISSLDLS